MIGLFKHRSKKTLLRDCLSSQENSVKLHNKANTYTISIAFIYTNNTTYEKGLEITVSFPTNPKKNNPIHNRSLKIFWDILNENHNTLMKKKPTRETDTKLGKAFQI